MVWLLERPWRCGSSSTLPLAALIALVMPFNGSVLIWGLQKEPSQTDAEQHKEILGSADVRACGPPQPLSQAALGGAAQENCGRRDLGRGEKWL